MEQFLRFFGEPSSLEYNFWGLLTLLEAVLAYFIFTHAIRKPARYNESMRSFLYANPPARTIVFAVPLMLFALISVALIYRAIEWLEAPEYYGTTIITVGVIELIVLPLAARLAERQWREPSRRLRRDTISILPRRPRRFDRSAARNPQLAQDVLETDPVHQARIANRRSAAMLFEAERRVDMLEEEAKLQQRLCDLENFKY